MSKYVDFLKTHSVDQARTPGYKNNLHALDRAVAHGDMDAARTSFAYCLAFQAVQDTEPKVSRRPKQVQKAILDTVFAKEYNKAMQ